MANATTSTRQELGAPGHGAATAHFAWRSVLSWRWEWAVVVIGVVASVAAVWTTLDAGFLQYPGWLAAQKADFILGPIGVGLYWRNRRPNNRLGLLLIVLGLIGVLYIGASTTNPTLFGIGVFAETPIYVVTALAILAFPSGRLDAMSWWLIAIFVVPGVLMSIVISLAAPHLGPGFSISGCRAACPANGLAIWSEPSWLPQFADALGVLLVAFPFAVACLAIWRFVNGTPPRRRAIGIGAPAGLLFLFMQVSYRTLFLIAPDGLAPGARPVQSVLQWTIAGARSLVWYGFLCALIAAELYAGRVLRQLVGSSLGRPSFWELEGMLREPVGDPGLRLGFWEDRISGYVDAGGAVLDPPRADQTSTEIDQNGRPLVVIVHDQQLVDDPELLRAAGAVALLALENAELDTAWRESLRALAESRARLTRASDKERRKLERDLHDGAQQRLLAALLRLSTVEELAGEDPELQRQLTATQVELEAAIEELRDLARGIYPTVLAEVGLAGALQSVALRSPERITVQATSCRFEPEIEAAVYYCCLEAVQNALKHAGPDAHTSIRVFTSSAEVKLEVRDSGQGFDRAMVHDGTGLQSMQDRLGAVGGHIEIDSEPGRGTVVTAGAPAANLPDPIRPAG